MKQSIRRVTAATALAASIALVLAGCSSDSDEGDSTESASESSSDEATDEASEDDTDAAGGDLSGNLAGAGASSQAKAEEGWVAGFMEANPDVQTSYNPVGSGGGREQFLAAQVLFAGTDSLFSEEEISSASERCFGGELIEVPVYISPIAVTYNLPDVGVDNLQLDAATIAGIFAGTITSWDDAAIADQNPDATLPSSDIIVVNRSDDSGTTENFTDYLNKAAPQEWTHEASGDWPVTGGEAGNGTTGVVQAITSGAGAIGYADASQIGSLHHAKIKVGDEYVAYTAEAAAKVVDASKRPEGRPEFSYAIDIQRDTKEAGAYPIVLVAYTEACTKYSDQSTADLVKAWLTYIVSEDGQQAAAEAAGSAPISATTRENAMKGINQISAGG